MISRWTGFSSARRGRDTGARRSRFGAVAGAAFAVRAVLQAWLLDATPPGLSGSAIGILFGAQAAGAAIGPISAGMLADQFGIMAAFYFLAGTIVVANMLVFFTPSDSPQS